MTRLPRLVDGAAQWSLPLSDHTAGELARLLLIDDSSVREARLASLMADDPALALWAVCVARMASLSAHTVTGLARWLSPHLLAVLNWDPDGVAPRMRDVESRWRELAVDSVAIAHLAASSTGHDPEPAEAFLAGLLYNSPEWLRSCGPRPSLNGTAPTCLPPWLIEQLADRGRATRTRLGQRIQDVVTLWRQADHRVDRVGTVDLRIVRRVRRRWSNGARFGHAGTALTQLTTRLRRLQDLEQQFARVLEEEKLSALGELAYGASHEINNPLANISTRTQALLVQEADPEKRRMLATINAQTLRVNEMIADMMFFARPPALVRQSCDLVSLANTVIAELQEEAQLQGTTLFQLPRPELRIEVDPTLLAAALRAVVLNAIEALVRGGAVEVALGTLPAVPPETLGWARISVHDTGPGIRPEIRRHLFDPFFSGREAGRGLGFGLSKCWRIVTLHGGRVTVAGREPCGTSFHLDLPLGLSDTPAEN
jgi:signal transduction histidine kinase